jgi:hypothetical protein
MGDGARVGAQPATREAVRLTPGPFMRGALSGRHLSKNLAVEKNLTEERRTAGNGAGRKEPAPSPLKD